MSNAQYETYGPNPSPSPNPAQETWAYGSFDPYDAQTLGYGVQGTYDGQGEPVGYGYWTHGPYAVDTYRPAYEAHGLAQAPAPAPTPAHVPEPAPAPASVSAPVSEAALPRQTRSGAHGEGPGALGRGETQASGGASAPVARPRTRRRASRRRKVRYAERPDGPMRRLLPQALVVAFLAGGTTAFVAKDKAIELSVDGKQRTLHTFADDVSELLEQEGVEVGAHDVVAPAPEDALSSGDEVFVRYGRPLRLTLDGHRREVWTTAQTVEGALEQLGVRAEGAYVSTSRSRRIGRQGLALDVRTERAVTIMADGRARTIRTNAATVREVVAQAGIVLRGQDTTSVAPGSFPRDGQTITVLRITGMREVREEAIPFETRRIEDDSLFRGTEVVEQAGQPGLRRITYSLRTVNGVRQRPRRIKTEVVRQPRTQLIKVGTKPLPTTVEGTGDLNWQGLAACESGGRPDAVDPSGTYGGLYQFDTQTWQSLGGKGRPQEASAAEQTLRAKKLYVRRGASPWPHCGARLHG